MAVLYAGALALAGLGPLTLWRIRADHRRLGRRSKQTAALVWIVWLLHGALTFYAAAESLWPLPLGGRVLGPPGAALLVLGTGIFVAGIVSFRSWKRLSGLEKDELVRSGIYRWSRNPQNVGWGLMLLGAALLGGSGAALLLVVVFWVSFRLYLVVEERHLARTYAGKYRHYQARTARFWGRPRRWRGWPRSMAPEEEAD